MGAWGRLEAVAFDLYHTLLDFRGLEGVDFTSQALERIDRRAAARLRVILTTRPFGTLDEALRQAAAECGAADDPRARGEAAAILEDALGRVYVCADALPAVRALKARGLRIAVISNLASAFAAPLLRSELAPWIDARVFSFEEGMRKPEAELYRRAAARLGLGGARPPVVMVGDSLSKDVQGPLDAGFAGACHLARPPERAEGEPPPGARRIAGLEELLELV